MKKKVHTPPMPLILCDLCDAVATRSLMTGPKSGRRVFCGDGCRNDVVFAPGRRENDHLRECSTADFLHAMRLQNVASGLLTRRRFNWLEKNSPTW